MKSSGVGRIVIAQGVSMWIGKAGEATGSHSHHAVQVTLGLNGEVRFKSEGAGWRNYHGAVISPHSEHAFCGDGAFIAHIFVEPESRWGRTLMKCCGVEPIAAVRLEKQFYLSQMLTQAYDGGSDEALRAAAVEAVECLAEGSSSETTIDHRILRSLTYIERNICGPVKLGEVANAVHLSAGRFRHLFVQETGLTLRAYVLWLRLRRAVDLIATGEALTSAAHAAGFADASHLSRTFRRMFGIAPASLHKD